MSTRVYFLAISRSWNKAWLYGDINRGTAGQSLLLSPMQGWSINTTARQLFFLNHGPPILLVFSYMKGETLRLIVCSLHFGDLKYCSYFCTQTSTYMRVLNYSDFRNNLAQSLNAVNDDREIVVVSRTKGKNVVVMDLMNTTLLWRPFTWPALQRTVSVWQSPFRKWMTGHSRPINFPKNNRGIGISNSWLGRLFILATTGQKDSPAHQWSH